MTTAKPGLVVSNEQDRVVFADHEGVVQIPRGMVPAVIATLGGVPVETLRAWAEQQLAHARLVTGSPAGEPVPENPGYWAGVVDTAQDALTLFGETPNTTTQEKNP